MPAIKRQQLRLLRHLYLVTCLLIIGSLVIWYLNPQTSYAAQLTNRSVSLSTAIPSATARHSFQFTFASTSNIGSIRIVYCDNSPIIVDSCTTPPGLNMASASLSSQSGNIGFSIGSFCALTCSEVILSRTSIPALAIPSSYTFDGVINPSQSNHTTYVRITTYATTDASGPYTDNGSVAFATIGGFSVSTAVPAFLRLCVAVTVSIDCSTASGDRVDLGTLTPAGAKAGQSEFSAATNSITGYVVFILGTTLTSGNNTIPALTSPTPSFPGNGQFGINLRANLNPPTGSDPAGPGSATPTADYNLPNFFKLNSGDSIASDNLPSDYNRMTVSYLANINQNQAPGIYNTTFTYLATADF